MGCGPSKTTVLNHKPEQDVTCHIHENNNNSSGLNETKTADNEQSEKLSGISKNDNLNCEQTENGGDFLLSRDRAVSIRTDGGYNDDSTDSMHSDVVRLYEAMNGFGCSEEDLVAIIIPAHNTYRQSLRGKFQENYKEDLIKCVKRNTSGTLQYLLVHLLMNKHEFICSLIRNYLEDRRYVWIAEVLTSFDASDINHAKDVYSQLFQATFETDVIKSLDDLVPANLKDVFLPITSLQRQHCKEINDECIQPDTDRLNGGPDGITEVLLRKPHNRATLAAIFRSYKLKYFLDIVDSIDIEFHDDAKAILLTIVQIAEDASKYFGNELVHGLESNNQKRILDILIARYQIDLDFMVSYYKDTKNGSLLEAVKKDFQGLCEEAVCTLIQKHVPLT